MNKLWKLLTEEGKKRKLTGFDALTVKYVAVIMSLYQLAQATFLTIQPQMHYAIHLTFIMVLCALIYTRTFQAHERTSTRIPIEDWIYAAILAVAGIYYCTQMETYLTRMPMVDELSSLEIVIGLLTVIAVIGLTKRCMGFVLPSIGCIFLAYALWGHMIPGVLYHRKLLAVDILDQLVFTTNGIYSSPIAAAATYVFMFVMFGSFFAASGAGDFFYKFSMAVAGRYAGGAGKVAIVTSGLFGMINGSPTANVVTTGSFTIPMMKKAGYDGTFSGAVTAVAATGGGIMPPIMGTAAFLMVEMAGISYKNIAIAAFVPGVLYYLALLLIVHFRAKKCGLVGLDAAELPSVWGTLKEGWIFLVPLVVLVVMLMRGYTANLSAVVGIVAVIAASWARKETRMHLPAVIKALEDAARSAVIVSLSCAVAGCVIAGLMTTGLSGKLASLILSLGGNSTLSALVLTAAICTLLGMGMPVAAAYCLTAALCIPSLYELGLQPLEAHMFVVYFATLSAITPPVAVASYAAAGISESNAATVGWQACRIGLVSFIVPFIFVFEPMLMVTPDNFSLQSIWIVTTATLGVIILCAGLEGFLKREIPMILRGVLVIGGLLLIYPGAITDYIGLGVMALLIVQQFAGIKLGGK